mmetsp:Transcript_2575/g.6730  ORF Transcript_2575/g.6730 Transcript_2575/m.6730 type:complete len:204 (-) Transcript_2575:238-849(-)
MQVHGGEAGLRVQRECPGPAQRVLPALPLDAEGPRHRGPGGQAAEAVRQGGAGRVLGRPLRLPEVREAGPGAVRDAALPGRRRGPDARGLHELPAQLRAEVPRLPGRSGALPRRPRLRRRGRPPRVQARAGGLPRRAQRGGVRGPWARGDVRGLHEERPRLQGAGPPHGPRLRGRGRGRRGRAAGGRGRGGRPGGGRGAGRPR